MKTLIALLLLTITPQVLAAKRYVEVAPEPKSLSADEIDDYAGQGQARDIEALYFSQQLVLQAQREGGTVKVMTWVWKGKRQWYAMRKLESIPGCTVWRGPNPPMGYHTRQRTYQVIDYSKLQ